MCSERWILVAEMCDSLQNKQQYDTLPACGRDDRKAITRKTTRSETVVHNRNVPAFTGGSGGGGTGFESRTGRQLKLTEDCGEFAEVRPR